MTDQADIIKDETITLVLLGSWSTGQWRQTMDQYMRKAEQFRRVHFVADVRDEDAWDGLLKFLFNVRWKLIGSSVDQRIALITAPELLNKATSLLMENTPNMLVKLYLPGQEEHAWEWIRQDRP